MAVPLVLEVISTCLKGFVICPILRWPATCTATTSTRPRARSSSHPSPVAALLSSRQHPPGQCSVVLPPIIFAHHLLCRLASCPQRKELRAAVQGSGGQEGEWPDGAKGTLYTIAAAAACTAKEPRGCILVEPFSVPVRVNGAWLRVLLVARTMCTSTANCSYLA